MSSSLVHDPKNNTKEKAVANDNKNFFILVGKSSVSCPLKPSDSAPLKHSTMPP